MASDTNRDSTCDPLEIYYKTRKEIGLARQSFATSSSIGCLDLTRLSSIDSLSKYFNSASMKVSASDRLSSIQNEPRVTEKQSEDSSMKKAAIYTPKPAFKDELASIMPDNNTLNNNQFIENPQEALKVFDDDEKKLDRPSFANSVVSNINFPESVTDEKLSIGEYFGKYSDTLSDIVSQNNENEVKKDGNDTTAAVRRILSEADSKASSSLLCENLLKLNVKTPVSNGETTIDLLSESRHSTPIRNVIKPSKDIPLTKDATPNAATVQMVNKLWQPRGKLLETSISETDSKLRNGDITLKQPQEDNTIVDSTLLKVIRKLANHQNGSVDCSALTPLMRENYPELLESGDFEQDDDIFKELPHNLSDTIQPGQWLKCGNAINTKGGLKIWKNINVSLRSHKRWLLLTPVHIIFNNQEFAFISGIVHLENVCSCKIKDTALPPNTLHLLKIHILPLQKGSFSLKIVVRVTDLETQDEQFVNFLIQFESLTVSSKGLQLLPALPIEFDTISNCCQLSKYIQLVFDGSFSLPIRISIHEKDGNSFSFNKEYKINGSTSIMLVENNNFIELMLAEDEKQTIEFTIEFKPPEIENLQVKGSVKFTGELIISALCGDDTLMPLIERPIGGEVAFARFLCSPKFTPTVFHSCTPGVPITKAFPIKNVGNIPLKLRIWILKDSEDITSIDNILFEVPETIFVDVHQQTAFNITFTGKTDEIKTKRFMAFRMEPNGRTQYEVPLFAILSQNKQKSLPKESVPSSSSSLKSVSTAISTTGEATPIKLVSTHSCLSWPSVDFQKEYSLNFQVKNLSDVLATARLYFEQDTEAFKIVNEKGEPVSKMRRKLYPQIASTIVLTFKPLSIGFETNSLIIETNHVSKKSQIPLVGHCGTAKIQIKDFITDLSGLKTIILKQPDPDSTFFIGEFRVFNSGQVCAFLSIRHTNHVPRIAQEIRIFPEQVVIPPNRHQLFSITQHVSRFELNDILSDTKQIKKLATLELIWGDEVNRMRLRRMIKQNSQSAVVGPTVKKLINIFENENSSPLPSGISDAKDFQNTFLSMLKSEEMIVVLEECVKPVEHTLIDGCDFGREFHTLNSSLLTGEGSQIDVQCDKSPPSTLKVTEWLSRQ